MDIEGQKREKTLQIISTSNPLQVAIPQEFVTGKYGASHLLEFSIEEFTAINPTLSTLQNPEMIILQSDIMDQIYDQYQKGTGQFFQVYPSLVYTLNGTNHVKYQKQQTLEDSVSIGQMTNQFTVNFYDQNSNKVNFTIPYVLIFKLFKVDKYSEV